MRIIQVSGIASLFLALLILALIIILLPAFLLLGLVLLILAAVFSIPAMLFRRKNTDSKGKILEAEYKIKKP